MGAELRHLAAAWGANLRSALEYRSAFLLQAGLMFLNNVLFLAFWAVFFERFPAVDGWGLRDVTLLFAVCATGFGLAVVLGGGATDIAREIAAGRLDTWLLRPRWVFLQAASARTWVSGFGDLASGVVLFVLSGHAQPGRILAFAAASSIAATVLLAFLFLCGSTAFVFGRTEEVSQSAFHGLITLAMYPPGLFHGGAKLAIYLILPAGLVGHAPAQLVRAWSWRDAGLLGLGAAALVAVATLAWRAGLRRYESGNLVQSAGV